MFERYIERENVVKQCEMEGLGLVLVFSPLAQGVLTGKYKNQGKPFHKTAERLMTRQMVLLTAICVRMCSLARLSWKSWLAAELGATLSQFALAWVLRQPKCELGHHRLQPSFPNRREY